MLYLTNDTSCREILTIETSCRRWGQWLNVRREKISVRFSHRAHLGELWTVCGNPCARGLPSFRGFIKKYLILFVLKSITTLGFPSTKHVDGIGSLDFCSCHSRWRQSVIMATCSWVSSPQCRDLTLGNSSCCWLSAFCSTLQSVRASVNERIN